MSDPESVPQALWIRKALSFSGYTILLYDYVQTLDQEITYVWNGPRTVTRVVFLFHRYVVLLGETVIFLEETGLLVHPSQNFCKGFLIFTTIFPFISTESIHVLVILRAWVIWGCKRRVAVALIWIYSIYALSMLGVAMFVSATSKPSGPYSDVMNICMTSIPPYVWSSMLASIILDTTVFVLTMRSLRQRLREYRDLYPSSLVSRLIRDASVFWLACILYVLITIVAFTRYASDPRSFISASFGIPILSVVGQRLVLNLRGLTVRTYSPSSVSADVDRQLAALDEATPERVQRRSNNGDTEIRVFGLEDFEDNEDEDQEVDEVATQHGDDAEAQSSTREETTMNAEAIELGGLKMRKKRGSTASLSITEVPRLPGESRA